MEGVLSILWPRGLYASVCLGSAARPRLSIAFMKSFPPCVCVPGLGRESIFVRRPPQAGATLLCRKVCLVGPRRLRALCWPRLVLTAT